MPLDMALLLAPLSDDAPCGDDLSFSTLFDEIAEARREDDPTLDQGDWVTSLKSADWPQVVAKSADALQTRTKDLRLAGWLAEALARTRGFAGLAEGLNLIERLADRYWDALHPVAEPGDPDDARSGNFGWLIGRLSKLVRELPLAKPDRATIVTVLQHQSALSLKTAIDRDPDEAERLSEGRTTLADLARAVTRSGKSFYDALLAEQDAAHAAAGTLAQQIDDRMGLDGPNFAPLIAALDDVRSLTRQLAREAGFVAAAASPSSAAAFVEAEAANAAEPESGSAVMAGPAGRAGAPRTRAQALAQLRQVADFFRRTEPHSPVAYLADRAANWGEMPLHVWLRAVLKDGGVLAQMDELLGVEKKAVESDDD